MGRTYRNKDKKFKKMLKEARHERKNKRHVRIDEYTERENSERKKKDTMGSYIFA